MPSFASNSMAANHNQSNLKTFPVVRKKRIDHKEIVFTDVSDYCKAARVQNTCRYIYRNETL